MKVRPVGAKVFHADGQTDTTKLVVFSRNFAKAPNKDFVGEFITFRAGTLQSAIYTISVLTLLSTHFMATILKNSVLLNFLHLF